MANNRIAPVMSGQQAPETMAIVANRPFFFNVFVDEPARDIQSKGRLDRQRYSLTTASGVQHTGGITNDDGKLVDILIITPYAQACRDATRMLAQILSWEICKDRIRVKAIDASQGDEADVVLTAYIVGSKGGFLF